MATRRPRDFHPISSVPIALLTGLALAWATPDLQAQSGTVEGSVRDAATGAPLAGAQVSIEALNRGIVTDVGGHYEISGIPAGPHQITITLLGYSRAIREVEVPNGASVHLDAELFGTAILLEGIVAVGSRSRPRTVVESAVPIDAIPARDFLEQGDTDLSDLLRTVVPSFNVNPQAPGDAARLVRPASLRGLAPDHTLLLVNGKRRHRASVITWIGNGFADGAQGPDVSVIPSIAVRQAEVLRDGASAQYGSDAIAGVINVALKDARSGGSVELRSGRFLDGGGDGYTLAGNVGLPLGETGFANLSAEFGASNPTDRSIQRDDAAALIAAGNANVRDPAQIWGSYAVDDDLKLWGNFGGFVADGVQIYGHAGYASETVEGGFFFRNPNTREGVFSIDGGETLLVGDMLDAQDGVLDGSAACPTVAITNSVPDPTALSQVLADPNCFTFQELFPGGFTPQYGGDTQDASILAGVRGHFHGGPQWDFSLGLGRHSVDFFISETVNASLGPESPTTFDPGLYLQRELNANLDLSYAVNDRLNVAGGAEYRDEYFEIGIGDESSWALGPLAPQGFSSGSNGFPGFSDIAAGGWHRQNWAGYVDMELQGEDGGWSTGTALRIEDFEDFGTTVNGKLAGRISIVEQFAVRASASTGFRAPTPGQQNAFNVSTQWNPDLRELVNNGTIPSTSRVAELKGGKPLDSENSASASVGLVMNTGGFTLSLDGFRVDVTDRLALSQEFELSPEEAERLIAEGITSARNLVNFRFFANDFDTRTQGFDLVASLVAGRDSPESGTELSLAFNYTDTEVTDFNPEIVNELRIMQLQDALPSTRWTASVRRDWRSLSARARASYYAGWFDSRDGRSYPGAHLVDLELRYRVDERTAVTVGADNALNLYPQRNPNARIAGNLYSPNSPFGSNGGYVYAKAAIALGGAG